LIGSNSSSAVFQSQAVAMLQPSTTMKPTLSKCTLVEVGSRGSDIISAGGPLEVLVGNALSSYREHEAHSMDAVRNACTLLSTSKGFQQAVLGLEGAVAVDFSPATTEAAAAFAGGHHPGAGGSLPECAQ
jgi:hypothetical protein